MRIILFFIFLIAVTFIFLNQEVDAKVVIPYVVSQDEKIKIISGIGYSNLGLT